MQVQQARFVSTCAGRTPRLGGGGGQLRLHARYQCSTDLPQAARPPSKSSRWRERCVAAARVGSFMSSSTSGTPVGCTHTQINAQQDGLVGNLYASERGAEG